MAKSVLEELVTVLGFEIDDDDLSKFEKQVESAKKGMKSFALVATASAAAVGAFLNSVSNATAGASRFSKQIDVSFDEMQRLTHATELWGGSLQDVQTTLTSLSRIASTAARGAGGGEIFGFLGISPTQDGRIKDSIQLLKEIADATNKIPSAARRADLLSQVGISERMILLLRQGSKGIEKLGAELDQFGFVLTEEQADNAEAYFQAVVKAKAAVKGLGNEIGLRLTPRLTETIDKFLEWVETNKKFTTDNIDDWILAFEKLLGPLGIAAALFAGIALASNLKKGVIGVLIFTVAAIVEDLIALQKGRGQFKKAQDALSKVGGREDVSGFVLSVRDFFENITDATARAFISNFGNDPSRQAFIDSSIIAGNRTIANEINFNINGAGDPRATSEAVNSGLEEVLRGEFGNVTVAPRT